MQFQPADAGQAQSTIVLNTGSGLSAATPADNRFGAAYTFAEAEKAAA
jgi:hypothetical protein